LFFCSGLILLILYRRTKAPVVSCSEHQELQC